MRSAQETDGTARALVVWENELGELAGLMHGRADILRTGRLSPDPRHTGGKGIIMHWR